MFILPVVLTGPQLCIHDCGEISRAKKCCFGNKQIVNFPVVGKEIKLFY